VKGERWNLANYKNVNDVVDTLLARHDRANVSPKQKQVYEDFFADIIKQYPTDSKRITAFIMACDTKSKFLPPLSLLHEWKNDVLDKIIKEFNAKYEDAEEREKCECCNGRGWVRYFREKGNMKNTITYRQHDESLERIIKAKRLFYEFTIACECENGKCYNKTLSEKYRLKTISEVFPNYKPSDFNPTVPDWINELVDNNSETFLRGYLDELRKAV